MGSQRYEWGRDPKTRGPVSNAPTTKGVGTKQALGAAKWEVSFVQEGEWMKVGGQGRAAGNRD